MTHADPDLAAILAAILAEPGDDLHRLAYADRCEELGDEVRAEFVRVQVELAALAPHRGEELEARERDLWNVRDAGDGWLIDTPTPFPAPRVLDQEAISRSVTTARFIYRRGFVDEVRCKADDWRDHGPALVRAHPVTRARLIDRQPVDLADGHRFGQEWFGWCLTNEYEDEASTVPEWLTRTYTRLHQRLPHTSTEADAWGRLSTALLTWAKEQPS